MQNVFKCKELGHSRFHEFSMVEMSWNVPNKQLLGTAQSPMSRAGLGCVISFMVWVGFRVRPGFLAWVVQFKNCMPQFHGPISGLDIGLTQSYRWNGPAIWGGAGSMYRKVVLYKSTRRGMQNSISPFHLVFFLKGWCV